MVLRGRSRRLRLAARRPRRAVQHRRPGLDGHAADRLDGAVRFHPAARRPLRHARPDRRHPRGTFNYGERWDGDRLVLWAEGTVRQEIAYGENLTLARRYEIEAGTSTVTIRDEVDQRGVLPDAAPDPLPLQPRLPVPAAAWPASSPARTGRSEISRSPPTRAAPGRPTGGSTSPNRSRTSPTRVSPCRSTRRRRGHHRGRRHRLGSRSHGGVPAHAAGAAAVLRVVADDASKASTPTASSRATRRSVRPTELLAQGWPLMLEPGERRATSSSSASSPATSASRRARRPASPSGHDGERTRHDEQPTRCLPGDPGQGSAGDRRR